MSGITEPHTKFSSKGLQKARHRGGIINSLTNMPSGSTITRTRGAALKKVSVGLLCEIRCQTREHVQCDSVWRDRRSRHYLVKHKRAGEAKVETGKHGSLSLK